MSRYVHMTQEPTVKGGPPNQIYYRNCSAAEVKKMSKQSHFEKGQMRIPPKSGTAHGGGTHAGPLHLVHSFRIDANRNLTTGYEGKTRKTNI